MANEKYKLKVNQKFEQIIDAQLLSESDIIQLKNKKLHLINGKDSYQAEVTQIDLENKLVSLKIGHESYEVSIADKYDQLIEKMGLELNVVHQVNEIKAPMPGMVIEIEVQVGQEIEQGDPLLILEAMKMENVIKSPGEGTVKSILVKKGQAVDKGEDLIEME